MTLNERNLMAWLIVVAVLWAMTGCVATVPPKVVTEVRTVEIKVPVREKCLKAEELPTKPQKVIKADADYKGLSAGAVADLTEWKAYYEKADALMKGCL
jgi:hypothetical protein